MDPIIEEELVNIRQKAVALETSFLLRLKHLFFNSYYSGLVTDINTIFEYDNLKNSMTIEMEKSDLKFKLPVNTTPKKYN